MVKKNKFINKLFGKDLTDVMYTMLEDFIKLDYDENQIFKDLKKTNEPFRMGMYLLALESNFDTIAARINRVNKKINLIRKDDFIDAYEKKKTNEYLNALSKADKISLLSDLGVDLPLEERMKLSKDKIEYYRIISNSVMLDQEKDNRDGLTTFLEYDKEEA